MMIFLIILLLLGSTSLSNVVSVNERLAYRHNNDLILVYKKYYKCTVYIHENHMIA